MDIGKVIREVDVVPREVPMTPVAPTKPETVPVPATIPQEVEVGG